MSRLTEKQKLAGQIVANLDYWHNPDLGYDEFHWVDSTPKRLISAFEEVLDYDGWRCDILRQYAWSVLHRLDLNLEGFTFPDMILDQVDWLKMDTLRSGYIEKAEREHKVLTNGGGLEALIKKAQEAEINQLIPQFNAVMSRLLEAK